MDNGVPPYAHAATSFQNKHGGGQVAARRDPMEYNHGSAAINGDGQRVVVAVDGAPERGEPGYATRLSQMHHTIMPPEKLFVSSKKVADTCQTRYGQVGAYA